MEIKEFKEGLGKIEEITGILMAIRDFIFSQHEGKEYEESLLIMKNIIKDVNTLKQKLEDTYIRVKTQPLTPIEILQIRELLDKREKRGEEDG